MHSTKKKDLRELKITWLTSMKPTDHVFFIRSSTTKKSLEEIRMDIYRTQ